MPEVSLPPTTADALTEFLGLGDQPSPSAFAASSRRLSLGKLTREICEEEIRAAARVAAMLGFTHAHLVTVEGGDLFIPARYYGHQPVHPRVIELRPLLHHRPDAMKALPNGKN